jgi:hypothetical protein
VGWRPIEPTPVEAAARAIRGGSGRARIRTPLPERRWRDVLGTVAEHLTEEELVIIRKQIAG